MDVNQLYYQCQTHDNMGGSIRILNNDSDFLDTLM